MSKLLLRILVCAGFGFYAFPISSAEKGEQEALSERTKVLSLSSQGELADSSIPQSSSSGARKGPKLLMGLEDRQKEVQKRIDKKSSDRNTLDYKKISLVLSQEYITKAPAFYNPAIQIERHSTKAVPLHRDRSILVSAKISDSEAYIDLRTAIHPTYVEMFLNGSREEKFNIFKSVRVSVGNSVYLREKKKAVAHKGLWTKRVDTAQIDFNRGATATAQQEKGHSTATSDLDKHQIMIGDIPLQYPVGDSDDYSMVNAILLLNFTFDKEPKTTEEIASLQSPAQSLNPSAIELIEEEEKEVKEAAPKSPVLLPSDSPEKKERRKEKKRASESAPAKKTKVVLSSEKPKGTQLRLETRPLIPLKTSATRSARSASAPKPTFMKGIEDRQVKLPPIPLDLTPYQTVCILNSVSDEAIEIVSESVWAHAKMRRETVDAIIRAVCEACLITPTVLKMLTEKEIQAACPTLSAHFMDIKDTDYHGGTSTSKEKEKGSGKGALVSYNLTLDNQPLQYRAHPSSPKMLPVPLLEVSITRVALGEKSEEKAEEKA